MTYAPHPDAPPMWAHQRRELMLSAHLQERALWWEMRTGKSRTIIDTAAYQYDVGAIDALLIAAYPSAVPGVWIDQEVPAYLPPRIPRNALRWRSSLYSTKWFKEALQELLTFKGLSILAFNCEALTKAVALWPYLERFCHKRRVMFVADESAWAASANSARSKRAEALARRCVSRRICDGTPVEESPFDAFAQCNLLHRGTLGYNHIEAFRARYGKYEVVVDDDGNPVLDQFGLPTRVRYTSAGGKYKKIASDVIERVPGEHGKLVGYQNLDELRSKLLDIGSRVLRKDCADIPDKLYEERKFILSVKQRYIYDELENEYRVTIDGTEVEVRNALARDGRLAMVARGWWPPEKTSRLCLGCGGSGCEMCDSQGVIIADQPRKIIDYSNNPALEVLRGLLEVKIPTIVWCRHRWDVTDVMTVASGVDLRPCRYDGSVHPSDRDIARLAFQHGSVGPLVGTPAAAGMGVRLDRAERIIYYSMSFSSRLRSQSEDRAEGLNKKKGTLIVDLIAKDTIDEHVKNVLVNKRDIAATVIDK